MVQAADLDVAVVADAAEDMLDIAWLAVVQSRACYMVAEASSEGYVAAAEVVHSAALEPRPILLPALVLRCRCALQPRAHSDRPM